MTRSERPVTDATFKIGGAPALIEPLSPPACRHCGQPMQFLAQIPLAGPLRLSGSFDMAYVFICAGRYDDRGWLLCPTYSLGEGANAVILQRGTVQGALDPTTPTVCDELQAEYVDAAEPRVEDPAADDDDPAIHWEHTKIGGSPCWPQQPESPPCPGCDGAMRYVAQIPAFVESGNPLDRPSHTEILDAVSRGERVKLQRTETWDLGFSGAGFVFVCEAACSQHGAGFLWQAD